MIASDFFELTLENIICGNMPHIEKKGFPKLYQNRYRQLTLPSGRRMDIFTSELIGDEFTFKVIELKRGVVTEVDLAQGMRYTSEVLVLANSIYRKVNYETVLIGSAINVGASDIYELSNNISVYFYDYDIDGVVFKRIHNDNILKLKEGRYALGEKEALFMTKINAF